MRQLLSFALLFSVVPAWAQTDEARLEDALRALRDAPDRSHDGLFPSDLSIERIERGKQGELIVYLDGSWGLAPEDALNPAEAEVLEELRLETFLGALHGFEVQSPVDLRLRTGKGAYRRMGSNRPRITIPLEPGADSLGGTVLRAQQLPLGGALAGRRIAISAGHGWTLSGGSWATQRGRTYFYSSVPANPAVLPTQASCGNCRGILEDFSNASFVINQLIPLLEGMGAEVVLVREPDVATQRSIVDNGDSGYREEGTWANGTSPGGYLDDYRTNAPGAGGRAYWDTTFGTGGYRRVAMRFLHGTNRTTQARVEIQHAGGSTLLDLDQTKYGKFWHDLGRYWFAPGTGTVALSNASSEGYLIADAQKLGSTTHSSGHPWWEVDALSYVTWAGGSNPEGYGDVSIRPFYSEEVGAHAYISFHSNAMGTTPPNYATGTSTYRYSCQLYGDHTTSDGATNCDSPPGSKRLLDTVHNAILARVRADWDPNWRDRGRLVANFGEVRPLASMPGILIESAFHDNALVNPNLTNPPRMPDNRAMHDPAWREAVAYGIAEGLAQYFNAANHAPPARPTGLRALNQSDGTMLVSWNAVPGAQGYRLYTLTDPSPEAGRERAWDAGALVIGTETVLTDLLPRTVYAFRVSALSTNGEGFASQAVTARFRGAHHLPWGMPSEALYVGAYDRRDAQVQEQDNDLSYAVEHGQALGGNGLDVFFDGALDEAVVAGSVPLGNYQLVVYGAGKDSRADESVSTAMQGLLATIL